MPGALSGDDGYAGAFGAFEPGAGLEVVGERYLGRAGRLGKGEGGLVGFARAPGAVGQRLVGDGCGIGEAVEGERAVVKVPGLVSLLCEFVVADFGSVLGMDELADCMGHAFDALVQAFRLGVEDVDEAPEDLVAILGERRAVGREPGRDDVHDLFDGGVCVVRVVDGPGVGLAAGGPEAEDAGLVHPVADVGAEGAVGRVGPVGIVLVVGVGFVDVRPRSYRPELFEFVGIFDLEGIGINVGIIHSSISLGPFVSIIGVE